ncbi:hypothetical protein DM02DRAFT_661061 [Periconia macrospinosa]|uniref:Uncharacterized protein n=1 Tax=Periconia macrospinosa TaxID=97972 RepID=A0A2V1DB96_9PLEO|nr:hypothetical protein DM02DRAFT_661061 [Periconia macrospinosa]
MNPIPVDECLGIAIDHRLRKLFRPVLQNQGREFGLHQDKIVGLGRSLLRGNEQVPKDELLVTRQLASPASIGGLVVVLLKPPNSLPYHYGLDLTVQSCPTLAALDEGFRVVTCGSLSLEDITTVDSLPFIRPKDKLPPGFKRNRYLQVFEILKAKRPDVILCMWQDKDAIGTKLESVQSIGVGKIFENSAGEIQLGPGLMATKVNAFHPSYAMYHHPTFSCFRQLLLLEIAQACNKYAGNWTQLEWMTELRERCRMRASELCIRKERNIKHFRDCLANALTSMKTVIISLRGETMTEQTRNHASYDTLLRTSLCDYSNDISLCLREIWIIRESIHPEDLSEEDKGTISDAVALCLKFLKDVVKDIHGKNSLTANSKVGTHGVYEASRMEALVSRQYRLRSEEGPKSAELVCSFLVDLNWIFELAEKGGVYKTCLNDVADLFLLFSLEFERILGELMAVKGGNSQQSSDLFEEALVEITSGIGHL